MNNKFQKYKINEAEHRGGFSVRKSLTTSLVVLLVLLASATVWAGGYKVTAIDCCAWVYDINSEGAVAYQYFDGNYEGLSSAAVFNHRAKIIGGTYASANGINDLGDVVGNDLIGEHVCAFVAKGKKTVFLSNADYSNAVAINNSGMIVGSTRNPETGTQPTIWQIQGRGNAIKSVTELTLGLLGKGGSASDVNNKGEVIGGYVGLDDKEQAFYWCDGTFKELAPGRRSEGIAIGDNGIMCGNIYEGVGSSHAAIFYQDGTFNPLPDFGGQSWSYGMNNVNEVVGAAFADDGISYGVVWQNGSIRRIDDLVKDYHFIIAGLINDQGMIVAYGARIGTNQTESWWLLAPAKNKKK